MQQRALANPMWLTLEQASRRLGVHPSTLRRWADEGAIDVFITPGGHRRFIPADLDRFAQGHHHSSVPSDAQSGWTDHAIALARQSLQAQNWAVGYDESDRESQRYLGRRLMGLVLQYVVQPDEHSDLLAEARVIGAQHARTAMARGRDLLDLLQAISFFRTTLLEVVLLDAPRGGRGRGDADAHLLRRIERLVGEVQAGGVELYLGERQ
ncbi:MAG TPA: helix-turn-helix domain-containing protein [Chloroflexota bacterium]